MADKTGLQEGDENKFKGPSPAGREDFSLRLPLRGSFFIATRTQRHEEANRIQKKLH
jgi:hypothetical protein